LRALVTGVSGQDGSYLAEQLLERGHDVAGLVRRRFAAPCRLVVGDLLDQPSLEAALTAVQPDVVFNLAAVTAPGQGWGAAQPPLLADVTGVGVVRLLDAMLRCTPDARLVHASSSAIHDPGRYGIYGAAKRFAHDCVVGYRDKLWCSNAVLFSHTSPRQDPRFLIRRICTAVANGVPLTLTDITSRRDWGWAPDYTKALQVIAEQAEPGDWTVASGETHAVRDIITIAQEFTGRQADLHIDPQWVGHELPAVLPTVPGWKPETSFADMVRALCLSPA
jgi:GDPmannose 4,6-dehydratase